MYVHACYIIYTHTYTHAVHYQVSSLRSIFTYHPAVAASAHGKPVLLMVGGQDK